MLVAVCDCVNGMSGISRRTLPEELSKHKKSVYTCFYHKVLARSKELLEKGDLETAEHLMRLLYANGYKG